MWVSFYLSRELVPGNPVPCRAQKDSRRIVTTTIVMVKTFIGHDIVIRVVKRLDGIRAIHDCLPFANN